MPIAIQHDEIVVRAAETFRLDANLIRALMMVESSGGNCWKPRYEAAFSSLWNVRECSQKLGITYATEEILQKMSWGPIQVMGATARWMGFEVDLPMLCEAETGIFYACKYLRWLSDKFGEEEHIVAAYNGGPGVGKTAGGMWRNQTYVDRVYGELRQLRVLN